MNEIACPHFPDCGGCIALDVPYQQQLDNKLARLKSVLAEHEIVYSGALTVQSAGELSYRNRMDFVFCPQGLALRRQGEYRDLIGIVSCAIANNKTNAGLVEVRSWFTAQKGRFPVFDQGRRQGLLKFAVIRASESTGSASLCMVVNKSHEDEAELKENLAELAQRTKVFDHIALARTDHRSGQSVSEDIEFIRGDGILTEKICGNILKFSSQSFFQNNIPVTELIISGIREKLSHGKAVDRLIDFYGGAGTIGICLADTAAELLIVDNDQPNIELAKNNIEARGISNAKAICADVLQYTGQLGSLEYSILIADPPRAGMGYKVIKALTRLRPGRLVYVSCDPFRTGREIKALTDVYDIKDISLYDMFPQTPHMEAVYWMELRDGS